MRDRTEKSRPRGALLLVDVSNHVWRAAAAHPGLTSRRAFTGGLYGFVTQVAKVLRDTGATRAAFCKDSRPYVRSRDYPAYKTLRKERQDDELKERAFETKGLVDAMLKSCGLAQWEVPGFESDDLIGYAARKYRHRFSFVWAASNDSDLFQFLPDCPRFAVYRGDGLTSAVRQKDLASLYWEGVTAQEIVLMQALQGTHNDIEGIRGIGPKKAMHAVRNPGVLRQHRDKHGAMIDRNVRLIELPHRELPRDLALPQAEFDAREFYRFLSSYEIDLQPHVERAFRQLGDHL